MIEGTKIVKLCTTIKNLYRENINKTYVYIPTHTHQHVDITWGSIILFITSQFICFSKISRKHREASVTLYLSGPWAFSSRKHSRYLKEVLIHRNCLLGKHTRNKILRENVLNFLCHVFLWTAGEAHGPTYQNNTFKYIGIA